MSSAQRITTTGIRLTENTSMAQWTTTLHSIIQPWQTPSSLDKMHRPSPWQEKRCRLWAYKTDPNMARRCGRPRVNSRPRCMPHRSSWTATFQTDGRSSTRSKRLNNSQIRFPSSESQKRTGGTWPDPQEDGMTACDHNPSGPIIRSQLALA